MTPFYPGSANYVLRNLEEMRATTTTLRVVDVTWLNRISNRPGTPNIRYGSLPQMIDTLIAHYTPLAITERLTK